MSGTVSITIDGEAVEATAGTTLGAVLHARGPAIRTSLTGTARGLFCGMGVCFECQVTVDGRVARACLLPVTEGMAVETGRT